LIETQGHSHNDLLHIDGYFTTPGHPETMFEKHQSNGNPTELWYQKSILDDNRYSTIGTLPSYTNSFSNTGSFGLKGFG